MKLTLAAIAALVLMMAVSDSAHAFLKKSKQQQQDCAQPTCPPPPVYPYGGGPWFAPCLNVRPPFPPFSGVLPAPAPPSMGGCPLPQHPYIRSPRDFFMYYDR
jgi:hypothetical protein